MASDGTEVPEGPEVPVPELLTCAMCQQLLCKSRMFDECGHTFCSFCLMQNDYAAMESTRSSTDYPVFKCPVCRTGSLKRWYERPLNLVVNQLAAEHPEYPEREAETERELREWLGGREDHEDQFSLLSTPDAAPPPRVNLARIAARARAGKAQELYRSMLPVLLDAAASGMCRVSFLTRARELNCVVGTLSRMLFVHGIHSIHSTARETTVFLTADQTRWEAEYPNPLYDAEMVDDAERLMFPAEDDESF
jgi:hypothetical protein